MIRAGPTGLVSALTFANAGCEVAVVDPVDRARAAASEYSDSSPDRRTTAHLSPTVNFLEGLGVWSEICRNACPLEKLVIIEDTSQRVISKGQEEAVLIVIISEKWCPGASSMPKSGKFKSKNSRYSASL